jgi:hypothetical protein
VGLDLLDQQVRHQMPDMSTHYLHLDPQQEPSVKGMTLVFLTIEQLRV